METDSTLGGPGMETQSKVHAYTCTNVHDGIIIHVHTCTIYMYMYMHKKL